MTVTSAMLETYPKDLGGIDSEATGRVLARHTGYDANLTRTVLEACAAAGAACGDDCESHASMHEHCRACAQTCRRCERACRDLISAVS